MANQKANSARLQNTVLAPLNSNTPVPPCPPCQPRTVELKDLIPDRVERLVLDGGRQLLGAERQPDVRVARAILVRRHQVLK